MTEFETTRLLHGNARALGFLTLIALAVALPAAPLLAAYASPALSQVAVTVQTTQELPFQYSLTAYNTSGYQVASYYGIYSEAAFGLPAGTYLITASAYYQQQSTCYLCPVKYSTGAPSAVNGSSTAIPIRYVPPYSEYGYAVVKVSGAQQLTIQTSNQTSAELFPVPVHVAYANGTAAVGASVSAYVVGSYNAYNPEMVTWGQTGKDGNVTLTLPKEPIQVNAYMSVPIQLPKNVSTVTVTIGGEKVNVTVYWQPNYINLVGQALILPPQLSADITLHAQTQYSGPIYYNSGTGVVTTVTMTTSTSAGTTASAGSPSQAQNPAQSSKIAPFVPTAEQLAYQGGGVQTQGPDPVAVYAPELAVAGGAAVIGVAAALLLQRRKQ